jgi:hypothetical protein
MRDRQRDIVVIMGEAAMFRELGATRVDQPKPGNGDKAGVRLFSKGLP